MKYSLRRACIRQLKDTFGLTDYRPGQKTAVYTLLSGRDVMCILPTGAGKSLCWQLPAVVHEGLTVVVSPLIALMRDQVQQLRAKGIAAVSLDSLLSKEEMSQAMEAIRNRTVRIVFVSPERLRQASFRQLCRDVSPWLVVVDEAHCIVQWGDAFRPAYDQIAGFLQSLPKRPAICAMTATANAAIKRAIISKLAMNRPKHIMLPCVRENLRYEICTTLDKGGLIIRICLERPCKTVIFCASRAGAEWIATVLREAGIAAKYYHAGMERSLRMSVQEAFRNGEIQVLCATSAFGMGIDIPDIRRVIHAHLPDDLIDYVQQSGRAGRDGKPAECILYFEPNDLLIKTRNCTKTDRWKNRRPVVRWLYRREYWAKVMRLVRVLLAEPCIPAGIAASLGQKTQPCGQCSACLSGALLRRIPRFGHMRETQMRLWFLRWQRDELAKRQGCRPEKIIPDAALMCAAKRFVLPADMKVPAQMERLVAYFRGERRNNPDDCGIQ